LRRRRGWSEYLNPTLTYRSEMTRVRRNPLAAVGNGASSLGLTSVLRWLLFRRSGRIVTSMGVGYLLGTFSTADVVSKRMGDGVDLRRAGSGNPGAANAIKVLGTKAGLAVMSGDIAKGALACGVGGLLAGSTGAHLAGTASVAGHCYPVWNGFNGGKGVAASVGQCLATFPAYFPIDVGVAAATAAIPAFKERAFAATLAASCVWVVGGVVWWAKGWRNLWGPKPTIMLPVSAALSSAIIARRFVVATDRAAQEPSATR
jgi:glycerol-3-phosphate acyltransferase PlsY